MQYSTLGKTGLKVSVAGLGCGGNSRIGLGTLTEEQSIALVREAHLVGHEDEGYGLTPLGRELLETFLPLNAWAEKWARQFDRKHR